MNPAAFVRKKNSANSSYCPIHSALLGLCLIGGFMTSECSFAQTAADIQAAQRQADIIQRQEQARLQKDQEENRQRTERIDGMDTDKLQPKIEVPALSITCRQIDTIRINASPNLSDQVREEIIAALSRRALIFLRRI